MSFELTYRQRELLISYAVSSPDEELCGLICGSGEIVTLENVAADPSRTFEMTVKDVLWATETFGPLRAVWHTHPSGDYLASPEDIANQPIDIPMVIVTAERAEVYCGAAEEAA